VAVTNQELGQRIARRRSELAMSQADLAAAVAGLTQSKLSKSESGQRRLSTVELAEIAQALGADPVDLLADEPLSEAAGAAARGGDMAAATAGLDLALAYLRVWEMAVEDGFPVDLGVKPAFPAARGGAVARGKTMAERVRTHLGLGTDPIHDLVKDVCAPLGLAVAYRPLPSTVQDPFDGLCVSAKGMAIAVVNTAERPRGRQRFTLAHELGHWMFGDVEAGPAIDRDVAAPGGSDMEMRANAFAAHLLVPDTALAGLDDVTAAVSVAYDHGVSVGAMAFRIRNSLTGRNELADSLNAAPKHRLAAAAGRQADYRQDGDAAGRRGQTTSLEFALREALEAGAISKRRLGSVLPDFDS
jgi:Zn-dependent peptidase ImmA (M78 family)/transcriptional regulator with XRE-family HTH domain